jgi:iron complex outermembrane recepter protein
LSDREWKNAESYSFNAATNLLDRDRFFVSHGVSLVGNRLDVSVKRPVGGFANSFLAGLDVSAMEFLRVPRYRGDVDAVDPLNPAPGVFGPLTPLG